MQSVLHLLPFFRPFMFRTEDFIHILASWPLAWLAYYLALAFGIAWLNYLSGEDAEESPFAEVYSFFVYALSIPGISCLCFWLYSALFESKHLGELNFYIYYLPLLAMPVLLLAISVHVSFEKLPWFQSLREVLALVATASFSLFLILDLLPVFGFWQGSFLFFLVLFGAKFAWLYFQRSVRGRL